jgi:hypothetical protein
MDLVDHSRHLRQNGRVDVTELLTISLAIETNQRFVVAR